MEIHFFGHGKSSLKKSSCSVLVYNVFATYLAICVCFSHSLVEKCYEISSPASC